MTLLCCFKLSGNEKPAELSCRMKKDFPNEKNIKYIQSILDHKNHSSVTESFSALLLLSKAIDRLDLMSGKQTDKRYLTFASSDTGKPYFEDSELNFSISHSRSHIAVALSDTVEVGVDIEAKPQSSENALKLASRFLSEDEAAAIKLSPDLFCRIWTQKEAEAKLLGIPLGEFLSMRRSENSSSDTGFRDRPTYFSFYEFCGYPVTICLRSNNESIEFIQFEDLS